MASNQDLFDIINQLFDCDWDECYDDETVRNIHQKMSAFANEYFQNHLQGSKEAPGQLVMLQEMKVELEAAIAEAKAKGQKDAFAAFRSLAREAHAVARSAKLESIQNNVNAQKQGKIAKIGIAASVALVALCGGLQGYSYMESEGQTQAVVQAQLNGPFKSSLKNEVVASLQGQIMENPDLISLKGKTSDIESKVSILEGDSVKVMELEGKVNQIQDSLAELSSLRGKISMLERSASKAPAPSKASRSVSNIKPKKAAKAVPKKTAKKKSKK